MIIQFGVFSFTGNFCFVPGMQDFFKCDSPFVIATDQFTIAGRIYSFPFFCRSASLAAFNSISIFFATVISAKVMTKPSIRSSSVR